MNLRRVFGEDTIRLELVAVTKEAAITELIDLLHVTGRIHNRDDALKAVFEREARMSTGMQNGLALPHAKSDAVDRLVAAMGLKHGGLPFQSIDGQPAEIVILTLSPLNRSGPHIQFLAEVGRLVQDPANRARILAAKAPAEVLHLMPP
jgi:PTS system nitrogen regulatory IIA component